jgi:nucleoside-diphosphate-sugar epimerase
MPSELNGLLKQWIRVDEVGPNTNWGDRLQGIDCVLHLAGLAHLPANTPGVNDNSYYCVNAGGTESLAKAALRAGVKRFILVSSIGVNGQSSRQGIFNESDTPQPQSAYASSKLEAENRLRNVCAGSGLKWVIIRPPLVYGPGAPGNFARLLALVRKGWPLPLGSAIAKKSFIGLDNLVSALLLISDHPRAADQIFLVCDGKDISTASLLRQVAKCMGRRQILVHVPEGIVRIVARITGYGAEITKLFEPLRINNSHICQELGWRPPVSLEDGLCKAAMKE